MFQILSTHKKAIPVLLLLFIFSSCTINNKEKDFTFYEFLSFGNGIELYKEFNSDSILTEEGYMLHDSVRIYEHIKYNVLGNQPLSYKFYNPIGEILFERIYDKDGKRISDKGSFFSFNQIENNILFVGDSVKFKVYSARPKGTVFIVYGISKSGSKYEIPNRNTKFPFAKEITFYYDKIGDFVFKYGVELRDTLNDITKNEEGSVSFCIRTHTPSCRDTSSYE